KYKNEVIVTVIQNDGYNYDISVSDNKVFASVGQKTSNNLNTLAGVSKFMVWAVKPDSILNLEDTNIKIYDDDGSLVSFNVSGLSNKQLSYITYTRPRELRFNNRDNNIRFDDFNSLD